MIQRDITSLQNSIDDFDGTLNSAIAVHNGAVAVGNSVDTATDEANPSARNVQGIADQTTASLDALVPKADQFIALGPIVTTLVNQGLNNLQTSADGLSDALIAKASDADAATGTQIKTDLDAAFADAKAAFA